MVNDTTEELKKIIRRIDSIQKSVDTLNNDRNMLEDIITRLSAVEQALHLNKQHQTEMTKELKAEVRESGAIVDNSVQEIKDKITDKTVIVKARSGNILTKIMNKLQKK